MKFQNRYREPFEGCRVMVTIGKRCEPGIYEGRSDYGLRLVRFENGSQVPLDPNDQMVVEK